MTSNEVHKQAAIKRGKARTDAVEAKVVQAMKTIEHEMHANDGIYPANGGSVSMNEVSRRAGINETTLFAPKQTELRKRVKDWIDSLKESKVVGRGRVQRKLAERVADWKQRFQDLVTQQIEVELELQNAQANNEALEREIRELQSKYNALLDQMQKKGSKVVVLPTKPGVR